VKNNSLKSDLGVGYLGMFYYVFTVLHEREYKKTVIKIIGFADRLIC
jgi:hypothetical protein